MVGMVPITARVGGSVGDDSSGRTSQHAKVDLKLLLVSVIPIYSLFVLFFVFNFN